MSIWWLVRRNLWVRLGSWAFVREGDTLWWSFPLSSTLQYSKKNHWVTGDFLRFSKTHTQVRSECSFSNRIFGEYEIGCFRCEIVKVLRYELIWSLLTVYKIRKEVICPLDIWDIWSEYCRLGGLHFAPSEWIKSKTSSNWSSKYEPKLMGDSEWTCSTRGSLTALNVCCVLFLFTSFRTQFTSRAIIVPSFFNVKWDVEMTYPFKLRLFGCKEGCLTPVLSIIDQIEWSFRIWTWL